MKRFLRYLKTRPLALISLAVILFLYLFMIFAEFVAPYPPTKIFEEDTFHPANLELTSKGLSAREYRVLSPITWRYAKVKGLSHKVSFFVKGEPYKLMGLIPCQRHLFGTKPDSKTGEVYPIFLFGADNLGRDLFSRMVYGSRISLTIGFVASAVSLILAMLLGGIAGYYGGAADWTVMRLSEFFMLIPGLYLILFLRSLLNTKMDSGTSYMIITLILSLVGWPGSARTLRGMIHALKREEFVQDAALEGVPSVTIIFSHIIPQLASILIVSTTLAVPGFIMSETTLSYLGLGIADPAVSWGSLINRDISTLSNLKHFPWLLTPVWVLLAVTLAFNFLGDALRDYFDPYHTVFPTWKRQKIEAQIQAQKSDDLKTAAKTITQPDKNAFLQVQDLSVFFAILRGNEQINFQSVKGVSFSMQKGEILGIVGESGSGKTVTTTAIPALLPPNAYVYGKIFMEGTELTSLGQSGLRAYRGKKIGLILQEPGRSFDPLQNIGSAFFETLRNSNPQITKEEAASQAVRLLDEVGLPNPKERLKNFPHQFSGGQLQRIGIALALSQGCELLIADEPTTALDVTIQAQIISLLAKLRQTRNLSIIFISHNIDLVADLCDRILVMHNGLIVEQGTAREIIENPCDDYTKKLIAARPRFGTHYTQEA
ncbi:MAG: dipeptide/oligopeptide/nickel ABC transporter permease/ATP-binding protein [Treponema sp.]|nr:dipeptide/oligopeptide/nickel ABC transporter permease/ATP-binding protein [Treponema sp.]